MQQTILDTEAITMIYHPDTKIIHHTIHQPISGEALRDALNQGAEFLKEHNVTKWLSDDRKNGPLDGEDIKWGLDDWNQRMMESGWKYWANIVPEEAKAASSLTPLMDDLHEHGLWMMVFTNIDDAFHWLNTMK